MEKIKCPKCGAFYPQYKNAAEIRCPFCGCNLREDIPLPESVRCRMKLIYSKEDCLIFSAGDDILKLLYGKRKAAGAREAELLRHFDGCPNIVKLKDAGSGDTYSYLLEKRYTTLSEYIRSKPIHREDIRRIAEDICKALMYCKNRGFYHLDVHPKNIYIDGGHALLGDFGNVHRISYAGLGLTEVTPRYVHPDYWLRKGPIDERWDLFSLSMVLYGLLNGGKLPFMDLSPQEAGKRISRGDIPLPDEDPLSGIAVKGLRGGFPTCEAFLRALMETAPRMPPAPNVCPKPQKPEFSIGSLFSALFGGKKCAPSEPPRPAAAANIPAQKVYTYPAEIREKEFDADRFATTAAPDFGEIKAKPAAPVFDADSFATSASVPVHPSGSRHTGRQSPHPFWASTTIPTRMENGFPTLPYSANPGSAETAMTGSQCRPTVPAHEADQAGMVCATIPEDSLKGAAFDADPVATTCVPLCTMPEKPKNQIDSVQFSALTEKKLIPGEDCVIQILMYTELFKDILEQAKEEVGEDVKVTSTGEVEVSGKSHVTIRLTSGDVQIEEDSDEFTWNGKYHKSFFSAEIPENYAKKKVSFKAYISINDLPAVRLFFTAGIEEEKRTIGIERYNIHSAFMSYASADRNIVTAFKQGIEKARPDLDVFMDVENLRSGSDWQRRLYDAIDRRDILFLCWSDRARNSVWVNREWRYALEKKGLDFIEPIPIEKCAPPEELSMKHFNDMEVLIRAAFKNSPED